MGDCSKGLHGPIHEWDVSRVTDMKRMFNGARSFNADLSQWDVSRVTDMQYMFFEASSFKQRLCGTAWLSSKAKRTKMFYYSFGSIMAPMRGLCSS